jgi:hypothetical protein
MKEEMSAGQEADIIQLKGAGQLMVEALLGSSAFTHPV